jgi:hypothetical protein
LKADLLGSAAVTITGNAFPLKVPAYWDLRIKAVGFDLTKANGFLKKTLPLTFSAGTLDVFSEVKSQDKAVSGYVKPFFENLDVIENKENFEGPRHFGIEITSAFSNLLLREASKKSTAAILEFSVNQDGSEFKVGKMIMSAVEHGYGKPLQKDFESKDQLETSKVVN